MFLNTCMTYIYFNHKELDSFRVIDNSGSLLQKPFDVVFRYWDYSVIFPTPLAASYLLFVDETWVTKVVITKRLTAPLPGKVKVRENCINTTAKTSNNNHNFNKIFIYYIYISI